MTTVILVGERQTILKILGQVLTQAYRFGWLVRGTSLNCS
jgi:hypothetical protein